MAVPIGVVNAKQVHMMVAFSIHIILTSAILAPSANPITISVYHIVDDISSIYLQRTDESI